MFSTEGHKHLTVESQKDSDTVEGEVDVCMFSLMAFNTVPETKPSQALLQITVMQVQYV